MVLEPNRYHVTRYWEKALWLVKQEESRCKQTLGYSIKEDTGETEFIESIPLATIVTKAI